MRKITALGLALVMAACGDAGEVVPTSEAPRQVATTTTAPADEGGAQTTSTSSTTSTTAAAAVDEPTTTTSTTADPPTFDPVAAAVAHLAEALGIDADSITAVSAEPAEVPTASPCGLSAEDEDGAASGISIGTEIVLDAAGTTYRYVALGARPFPCWQQ